MRRVWSWCWAASLLLLVGCEADTGLLGDASGVDSGLPGDAGIGGDSGVDGDAGQPTDAAVTDGGTPVCGMGRSFSLDVDGWSVDPLEGRLAGGPLASLDALKVAGDTLRALQAIHDEGLVHGDITPSNLLVHDDADGVAGATLLGSGIDSFVRRHCQDVMPGPVGSGPDVEAYWAPERLRGGAPSVAADIYAVGVLLHRLVTGELPRGSISPEAFADIPGLPDIVRCATQDDPHARYRNAEAMLAALDWLDVVSAKMSPHTQDIPLWMETSMVGSIPVTALGTAPEVVALPGKPPSQKPPAPPTPPLPRRPPPGQPPPIPPEAVIRGATPTWPGVRSTQTPTGGVTRGAQPTGATRPTQPAQPTVIVRRSRSQRTLLLLVALLSIVILGLLALLLSRQGPRSGGLFDPQPVHRVASGDTPG